MQLNGARILIECLIREGVNIIFGYPGGSVLDIYDELPQYGEQLRHVLVRHEQAAVHAAEDTPALRARSASAWPHPAPEPPTR